MQNNISQSHTICSVPCIFCIRSSRSHPDNHVTSNFLSLPIPPFPTPSENEPLTLIPPIITAPFWKKTSLGMCFLGKHPARAVGSETKTLIWNKKMSSALILLKRESNQTCRCCCALLEYFIEPKHLRKQIHIQNDMKTVQPHSTAGGSRSLSSKDMEWLGDSSYGRQ